jgi:hypothetical protein
LTIVVTGINTGFDKRFKFDKLKNRECSKKSFIKIKNLSALKKRLNFKFDEKV